MASQTSDAWIVDSHTHILPARLGAKIRAFFNSVIDLGADSEAHLACCPPAEAFDAAYETPDAFPPHGRLHYPYHESDPAELASSLLGAGIKSNWVLPYAHKSGMASALNEAMSQVCTALRTQGMQPIQGFTVHPSDGAEEVERTTRTALSFGAKVAKLHCSVGSYSILDASLAPFWRLAETHRFPVTVHVGTHVSGNTSAPEMSEVEVLARMYPEARVVIAHSGSPAVKAAVEVASRCANVYLDTTPTVTRLPNYPLPTHAAHATLLELARSGRVLYGSDVPNVMLPLEEQLQGIVSIFGSEADRAALARGESWRSLGIDRRGAGEALAEVLGLAAKRLVDNVKSTAAQEHL